MVGISKRGRAEEGRPTKYKPEYCQLLIEHMADGMSYESFVSKITDNTICLKTLYTWEKNYPEFLLAKMRGKELSRGWWEHVGREIVTGGSKGNASAWIFVMKCRFGYQETSFDLSNMPTDVLKLLAQQALDKLDEKEH